MNESHQLESLEKIEEFYSSFGFPVAKSNSHRHCYENPAYGYSDAIILYWMMRYIKPRRIIEAGSGYSSCAMLDSSEKHLDRSVQFMLIEPYPALLRSLIRSDDLSSIKNVESRLQNVPISQFQSLKSGDYLFVDSTHINKTGSEVNCTLLEIFPTLADDVCVHFHNAFFPFEYPRKWIFGGCSWSEIDALRAFLQCNTRFTIEIMNTFLERFDRQLFVERMPLCMKNTGGSIWLRQR